MGEPQCFSTGLTMINWIDLFSNRLVFNATNEKEDKSGILFVFDLVSFKINSVLPYSHHGHIATSDCASQNIHLAPFGILSHVNFYLQRNVNRLIKKQLNINFTVYSYTLIFYTYRKNKQKMEYSES